jgi:hypothetical protein
MSTELNNHARIPGYQIRLSDTVWQDFWNFLCRLQERCTFLGLSSATLKIEKMKQEWPRPRDWAEIRNDLTEAFNVLQTQLHERLIMFIPTDKVVYYNALAFFGPEITSKFSNCTVDLDEAGKCFAAGRWTATVFHLMRVMEHGVRQLANTLGVAVNPTATWGQILNQLDAAINALPQTTPAEASRRAEFQGLRASLHAVKDAWRNPTMHPQATYTEQDAHEIITNVKTFLRRLATLI